MLRIFSIVSFALAVGLGLSLSHVVQAGEDPSPQELPKDFMKNDKLQKTRGEVHARYAKQVGKWKVTSKWNPMYSTTVDTAMVNMKLTLDGNFLISEGAGSQMGAPIKTFGIYGYDTLAKEYIAINLNNQYTASYEMRGKMRKDGVIEYKGMMVDAMTPAGRPYKVEEITHSEDKFEIAIYSGVGPQAVKLLTMMHERVK
ncbi:MAG: hypothetical protein ACI97A_003047 [Planctomycetota bacterium]|jgi:hypothetical protein